MLKHEVLRVSKMAAVAAREVADPVCDIIRDIL